MFPLNVVNLDFPLNFSIFDKIVCNSKNAKVITLIGGGPGQMSPQLQIKQVLTSWRIIMKVRDYIEGIDI